MAEKLYYSMSEVAEMFDVNQSLIRYWESKFDCLRPKKNKKGNRMFRPEDIEHFKVIYHLVKERGMTLAGAAQYLKNGITDTMRRDMELLDRLQRIRAELVEVREQLKDTPDGYTVVEVAQVELEEEVSIEVAPAESEMPKVADAPAAIEEVIEEMCEPAEEIDNEEEAEVEELIEIIYDDEVIEEELVEKLPAEPTKEEPSKQEEPQNDTPEEEPTDNTPRPRGAKAGRRSKKQEAKLFEVKPEKQRPIAPFFDQTLF